LQADGPLKSQLLELSKENEKLRDEIKQAHIMREKEAKEKSKLEKENKRMSSQLEAFGKYANETSSCNNIETPT
jgi:hypothetical protein